MLTPEEINETNAKVRDQIEALCRIVEAHSRMPRSIQGDPERIKISYDGQGGCRRLEWIAVEDKNGNELDIPEVSIRSSMFMNGNSKMVLDLTGNLLELAGIESWAKDDGSHGGFVINLRTGVVEDMDHEVRVVTYETVYIDMDRLLKDVPVGPTPV